MWKVKIIRHVILCFFCLFILNFRIVWLFLSMKFFLIFDRKWIFCIEIGERYRTGKHSTKIHDCQTPYVYTWLYMYLQINVIMCKTKKVHSKNSLILNYSLFVWEPRTNVSLNLYGFPDTKILNQFLWVRVASHTIIMCLASQIHLFLFCCMTSRTL